MRSGLHGQCQGDSLLRDDIYSFCRQSSMMHRNYCTCFSNDCSGLLVDVDEVSLIIPVLYSTIQTATMQASQTVTNANSLPAPSMTLDSLLMRGAGPIGRRTVTLTQAQHRQRLADTINECSVLMGDLDTQEQESASFSERPPSQ
jgi:hypothetical protein